MRSLSGRPVSAASIARWAMTGLGLLLALSGCVKGSSTSFGSSIATPNVYTLGGTVAGLGPYSGLVLANGGTTVAVAPRATVFTFPTSLAYGSTYAVTVQASPPGLICSVAGGSGTITANVANIVVNCATQAFTVGGTIAVANSAPGTSVAGLVLANGADTLTVPTGRDNFHPGNRGGIRQQLPGDREDPARRTQLHGQPGDPQYDAGQQCHERRCDLLTRALCARRHRDDQRPDRRVLECPGSRHPEHQQR